MPQGKDVVWLEQLHQEFVEAFRNNDLKALGSFYVEDAVLLPPGRAALSGRDAIVAFWESAERVLDLIFETTDIRQFSDTALREAGNLLVTWRDQGRETRNIPTKYVSVWLKVGGSWKLESLIWNGAEPRRRHAGVRQGGGPGVRRGGQGGAGRGRGQGRAAAGPIVAPE